MARPHPSPARLRVASQSSARSGEPSIASRMLHHFIPARNFRRIFSVLSVPPWSIFLRRFQLTNLNPSVKHLRELTLQRDPPLSQRLPLPRIDLALLQTRRLWLRPQLLQ